MTRARLAWCRCKWREMATSAVAGRWPRAWPRSPCPRGSRCVHVYESLRDEILDDLKAAMPVDLVLLGMHGAMVADRVRRRRGRPDHLGA